jgi:hypothetical protein
MYLALLLSMMLMAAGCNNEWKELASSHIDITVELQTPEGPLPLQASYHPQPTDVPGCFQVIAHTNGKNVYNNLWLSFCVYDDTPIDGELQLERLNFGAVLSSNSQEYTQTFTGKMTLASRTNYGVAINMDNVHFKIAHGEYVLNGILVAKVAQ